MSSESSVSPLGPSIRASNNLQQSPAAAAAAAVDRALPLGLFIIFSLWTLVLTYPLGLHLFSHIPLGDERVGTVPFFNLWTLQWTIDQTMQGFPNFWDAPIFAPAGGTFAFSETQPLSGLLAAPLWLGLQSPAFGYNALVLLFLTLNGWFAYWLLRSWGVARWAALMGGLLMQSLPFVAQEMGVLQLIAIFGFLWSLLFLGRFLGASRSGQPARRNGFCLALGTPVTFFTCSYYGLCSILFLPLAFLFQLHKRHFRLRSLARLLVIGLLILGLSGPFLWVQRQHLAGYGFSRSTQTIQNNSARPGYYANFLDHNLLYGRLLPGESGQGQRLFPGFGLVLLAGLGLFGRQQSRVKRYLLLAALLAFGLSLGLRLDVAGFVPYQWIRENVPGFGQLRSPFRFAVLVQIHLALLAGFGLHNLGRWPGPSSSFIVALAASLAIVEAVALPLPLQAVPNPPEEIVWQSWLNEQARPVRIVMLPFAASNRVADFEQTTRWMLANRRLQGDMVNGYSGFFPRNHIDLRTAMLEFPTPEGIELLREKGVDYVLVFQRLAAAPEAKVIEQYLPLVYQDVENKVAVYALDRSD